MNQIVTTAQLSTLNDQVSELNMRLHLATDKQVADYVEKLLTAGMAFPSDLDPKKAGSVYAFALNRVAKSVLQDVIIKLIRGELDGFNPSFLPRPAELAQVVRKRMAELSSARLHVVAKIDAINEIRTSRRIPSPPGEIERVRQMNEEFQRQHKASKRQEDERLALETEEQRDYWKRIADLKDSPDGVTEDHLAFRRKIAAATPSQEINHGSGSTETDYSWQPFDTSADAYGAAVG